MLRENKWRAGERLFTVLTVRVWACVVSRGSCFFFCFVLLWGDGRRKLYLLFSLYTLVSTVLQEVVFREDSEKNGLGVAPRSCFGVQGGCFLSSLSEGSAPLPPTLTLISHQAWSGQEDPNPKYFGGGFWAVVTFLEKTGRDSNLWRWTKKIYIFF